MPKMSPRWHRDMKHEECARCKSAADSAKTEAIVSGSDTASCTKGDHAATVTGPVKYIDKTRGQRS
jgi:hypothetical protein